MKKRLMSRILSVVLIVLFFTVNGGIEPTVVNAEVTQSIEVEGVMWNYRIDYTGEAVDVEPADKTKMKENGTITSIIIPESLDGKKVTSIKSNAFYNCTNLTSIIIPESVKSIGTYAFDSCYRLASITIPQKVTSIGQGVFYQCYALSNVIVSDEVTSIGNNAFYKCRSLTSIIIPGKVTSIGDYAFEYCDSLMRINIPNSVTSIGCASFASRNLKEILVSNDNPAFESVNGVLYNKQKTSIIAYPIGKYERNYNILESITSIGDGAFYLCSNLTSIIIPKGVTSIGKLAFYYCLELESIIIPKGVTSIGKSAFYYCLGLESIIIPEGVTSIGKAAFYNCWRLESIIIPEGINIIEYGTFTGCNSLKSIIIPEGVTRIEDYAFGKGVSLNYISVPSSVSFISERVLYGCEDNLITICADIDSYASKFKWGNNVVIDTNIGYISEKVKDDAKAKLLEGKNALRKFVNDGGLSTDNLYLNLNTEIGIYLVAELIDDETDLKALKLWILNLDEKMKALNFEVNKFTTGVASPQNIGTEITLTTESSGRLETMETKYEVYDGNTWTVLKDYSSEVTAIWKPQKAGIYKINATVKDGTGRIIVKSLDFVINPIKYSCEVNGIVWNYEVNDTDNAVNVYPSDKTLTSVKIPSTLNGKKVISIKESAFLNCSSLSSIIIPEGVKSIGKEAFKDCTSLERISIPSSVTNIDSTAFENCVKLTSIYTDSGSYASSYNWANGAVDTNIGYTKGSLIIELGNYDTNLDGTVNIIDLANVAKNYNTSKSDTNWQEKYDYNYDGIIDLYDLVKISKKIK